jgi:hypothetical protein
MRTKFDIKVKWNQIIREQIENQFNKKKVTKQNK